MGYAKGPWAYAAIFSLFVVAGMLGQLTAPAQQLFVVPLTSWLASISAFIVSFFDPAVVAQGKVLVDANTAKGVVIEAGCNGVEACIVFIAAVAAQRASWRHSFVGAISGVLAIQGVNILRIISLFYLAALNEALFQFAHRYAWQALIMLDVVVVWLLWLRWIAPARAAAPASPSADGARL